MDCSSADSEYGDLVPPGKHQIIVQRQQNLPTTKNGSRTAVLIALFRSHNDTAFYDHDILSITRIVHYALYSKIWSSPKKALKTRLKYLSQNDQLRYHCAFLTLFHRKKRQESTGSKPKSNCVALLSDQLLAAVLTMNPKNMLEAERKCQMSWSS